LVACVDLNVNDGAVHGGHNPTTTGSVFGGSGFMGEVRKLEVTAMMQQIDVVTLTSVLGRLADAIDYKDEFSSLIGHCLQLDAFFADAHGIVVMGFRGDGNVELLLAKTQFKGPGRGVGAAPAEQASWILLIGLGAVQQLGGQRCSNWRGGLDRQGGVLTELFANEGSGGLAFDKRRVSQDVRQKRLVGGDTEQHAVLHRANQATAGFLTGGAVG